MLERFPNYLFTRITASRMAMQKKELDQVLQALGTDLDIQKILPTRSHIHITELHAYYLEVGEYYALAGESDLALGVVAALRELKADEVSVGKIQSLALTARLEDFTSILQKYQDSLVFFHLRPGDRAKEKIPPIEI